jgi:hypothetical protein
MRYFFCREVGPPCASSIGARAFPVARGVDLALGDPIALTNRDPSARVRAISVTRIAAAAELDGLVTSATRSRSELRIQRPRTPSPRSGPMGPSRATYIAEGGLRRVRPARTRTARSAHSGPSLFGTPTLSRLYAGLTHVAKRMATPRSPARRMIEGPRFRRIVSTITARQALQSAPRDGLAGPLAVDVALQTEDAQLLVDAYNVDPSIAVEDKREPRAKLMLRRLLLDLLAWQGSEATS